jgi:hypothetical protein
MKQEEERKNRRRYVWGARDRGLREEEQKGKEEGERSKVIQHLNNAHWLGCS